MNDIETTVEGHYGGRDVLARIEAALREAGVDPERPTYEDLFPFDQLHGRGLVATREHADRAGLRPQMHVLDVGCGIGGASRYLAGVCGCRVTGIDLTQTFIDVGRELTARCGLQDRVALQQANALDLPFEPGTFDHVWSHNVTMNIPDKQALAAEVARVLKPGGRLSCVEAASGEAGEPYFPLPWATDPSWSFLVAPEEMRAALEESGLRVMEQVDLAGTRQTFEQAARERANRGDPPMHVTHIVMGDEQITRSQNMRRSVAEGRAVEQFILAVKG